MANLLFATRESDSLRSENPGMSQPSRGLVLVFHRDADPPWTKLVADSSGCRRRGWRFPWCERARVLVGSGAPEAPPIAPWAARPGSALFRLSSRGALRQQHKEWRELWTFSTPAARGLTCIKTR